MTQQNAALDARAILAVVLAPAFIATLLSMIALSRDFEGYEVPIVISIVYFSYVFGLIPAALAMYVLRRFRFRRLWHFVVAGLIVGIVAPLAFALIAYSSLLFSDTGQWLAAFFEYSEVMLLGPLTGAFVWAVSEAFSNRDANSY